MKSAIIIVAVFFLNIAGCSTTHQLAIADEIEVISAEFKHWSEMPVAGSDVRERGTDLKIIVENWPSELRPAYIIFRNKKSFAAKIIDSTETSVTISARILRRSSVLTKTSASVDLSDRLVFENEEGKTGFAEIKEWNRMREEGE